METYAIEILNPKAVRLLQDLADLDLIILHPRTTPPQQPILTETERTEAYERVMRGGSQTLDVDEMVAYVQEMRERELPFRHEE